MHINTFQAYLVYWYLPVAFFFFFCTHFILPTLFLKKDCGTVLVELVACYHLMVFSNNESKKRRQKKIVADIASSSLITLKIEGHVERTALWDTVLWVLYVPLHMTHNGKCSSPYCKNSLNSTLVHDFWPYPRSSPHTLGSFGTVCLALAHHFCTLLAQSVYFSSKTLLLWCISVSVSTVCVCFSLSLFGIQKLR